MMTFTSQIPPIGTVMMMKTWACYSAGGIYFFEAAADDSLAMSFWDETLVAIICWLLDVW